MKNKKLPFEIGEHYENWEFDLEILNLERVKGYDSYIYIREIIFLDKNADYIELIFLFDILQFVLLIFTFKSIEELVEFTSKIKNQYTDLYCRENGLYAELYYGKLKDKAHF